MKAYFAGGCFWCVTPVYKMLGADKVTSGFSGGNEENPSYEDVKNQKTGHRETVMIDYDPEKLPYGVLLETFFANVDPFDPGGQFIDRGRSYTLAVYYTCEEEKKLAEDKIELLEAETGREVFVSVEPFSVFYDADEYHQDFYLKHPDEYEKEMNESGRMQRLKGNGNGDR